MAGRQIKPSKGANDLYDAGRGHVYAEKIQPLPDNMKKKISVILEAIPSKSKSEIAEVLQACDYDVDRALNCFIADGGMEAQNEWMVQGKGKNKKRKKSGKKALKDGNDYQSQNEAENAATGPKTEKKDEEGQKKVHQNHPNGTVPTGHATDKSTTTNEDSPKPLENLKPVANDDPKPTTSTSLATSPPLSPGPLLSPTDSVSSSQDSQTFNKSRAGSSANEKHPRVRTTSTSGPEVVKRSLKDLQRSAVSIARFQSLLDEQAESSTKTLAKSFQAIRQASDERERSLGVQLQCVIEEAKKLLEERQENAAGLKFKCNRVGSMSDEETTELRNEIKHFVGERRIDEDLGKTMRFLRDQEKILETVKTYGEVLPIKHHYTPFKRKHPEPAKPHKPTPVKSTTPPTNVSTTTTTSTSSTKAESSSETKSSNSRNAKRPLLSPSRLKDQAEIHARLQQAVKEQQVSPVSKEGSKKPESNASEKPKPKDFGPKPFRNNNRKGQQGNSRREQAPQRQRQTNSTQNSTKSFSNRHESKLTNGENSKNKAQPVGVKAQAVGVKAQADGAKAQADGAKAQADGAKAQENGVKAHDGSPADSISQAQGDSPADNGTQAQEGSPADNGTQAQKGSPADNGTQAQKDKPTVSGTSATTAHDTNGHVTPNQGNRRTKRRYIRKTPPDDGGPIFRTATVDTSNNPSSAMGDGDHNESGKSPDLPNGQFKSQMANGTNGFVPLPQRNRRQRKIYCKKDPGSKIEFPPARENGSVPA